uniref:Putative LOV domain-containing protein n=1 Tax=Pseudolycopodiella caroliniana TaxID=89042 RepID=A0A126X2G9_9TRAC|nr:putative LOV domain-containing protein [Pseudolycopodiella caroliniana]
MGRLAFPNVTNDQAAHNSSYRSAIVESLKLPYDGKVQELLNQHDYSFVLCDPKLPDLPIVYASKGFLRMSGYSAHEVLGRNCRFLQGRDSDKDAVLHIRKAVREERSCQVLILNYTKQGKALWNLLHIAPVFSQRDGKVIHFVGLQTPVSLISGGQLHNTKMISDNMRKVTIPELKAGTIARGTSTYTTKASSAELPMGGYVVVEVNTSNSRLKGVNEREEFEDIEENNRKATTAVKTVVSDLMQSRKCNIGVAKLSFMCSAEAGGFLTPPLELVLSSIHQSFVLADPNLSHMPIVHASDMFLRLTGYSREEVLGRNCKFLHGPDTDVEAVEKIRESIKDSKPCTVRILNYRKNKQPFWNLLYVAPVRSADGKVAYHVGVQLDLTVVETNGRERDTMSARMKQLGAVGAIKVAVRGLQRTLKVPFT